ncbi:MAG: glycerol-3-phosphate 1-O-acyltransferase PlsY [Lachnospiraceae bacterium]|nr:glycerol-3-phosphate 1-O-acyltransferase PlsY [Lachnospiraceae bacterium]
MLILCRILCIAAGYGFGLFQTAFIYGKMHGIDIRDYGSGNSGTTNALRTLGKKAGGLVLLGDFMKCFIACMLVRLIFHYVKPDMTLVFVLYTALGVGLGHIFPFYMDFKGGKGIAVAAGIVVSMLNPWIFLICAFVFFSILYATRYVSLSSILMLFSFYFSFYYFLRAGKLDVADLNYNYFECLLLLAVYVALAIFMHRENIKRLMNHEERVFTLKSEKKLQEEEEKFKEKYKGTVVEDDMPAFDETENK